MVKLSRLDPPVWLTPYVEKLQSALDKPINLIFASPPQHGKSSVLKHAYISYGIRRPGLSHAYCTYNQEQANLISDEVKRIAFEAGLDPHGNKKMLKFSGPPT